MTPSYGDLDIKAEVRRSRAASGVPAYVEDETALDGLAAMFAGLIRGTQKAPAGTGASSTHKENSNA